MTERLDYIIAISEEQNITRAAQRLYISQPALTKYINKLEAEYSITIFDRTSNPIILTECGKLFLDEKIKLSVAEQNLRRRLLSLEQKQTTLTIGTGHARCSSLIPKLLSLFCGRHPEIDVNVVAVGERKLPGLISQGKIDFAIGAFSDGISGMCCHTLNVERLALVIPLKYGLFPDNFDIDRSIESPLVLQPDQLNGLPYILPSDSLGSYESYLALANQHSIQIRSHITVNNPLALRNMVNAGLGYSYCSIRNRQSLQDYSGNVSVGCATLPGLPTQRSCLTIYPKDHPHKALFSELQTLLQEIETGIHGFTLY